MKKIVACILCFFVVISFCSAQKTIDAINGFDWMGWTTPQKIFFIEGFYNANCMVMAFFYETNSDASEEQKQALKENLENQFGFTDTIGEMISKLNDFYSTYENKKYSLYRVIPLVAGKSWWDTKSDDSES